MTDKVSELTDQARTNLDRRFHNMTQYTLYGDFEYVPIQKDRQEKIKLAFQEIDRVCKPTLAQLRQQDNIAELQNTIYKKFQNYEGQLNSCIMKAKNVRDSNACADIFTDQILGEGKNFVIQTLRKY
ncbi:hypothetical protein PPERSA_00606 [Pseudocohnilembus persalinus]|uniref:Uncharacterized protein n=1 Tax=Pseudocohnilembus persalinus TaxID=266149 RepID=A0A0V0QSJ0_PSEPJ|nr:hypothetical protein PPERSA_00606 [Pseudocohnilembus persalinus]|eukprot:KRX05305.1 hypothetical protein PPERSA_00606 [Pseudocohnilembus persalinus]